MKQESDTVLSRSLANSDHINYIHSLSLGGGGGVDHVTNDILLGHISLYNTLALVPEAALSGGGGNSKQN